MQYKGQFTLVLTVGPALVLPNLSYPVINPADGLTNIVTYPFALKIASRVGLLCHGLGHFQRYDNPIYT